eukprot:1179869-Prorocentrum_minimum.AAC.7
MTISPAIPGRCCCCPSPAWGSGPPSAPCGARCRCRVTPTPPALRRVCAPLGAPTPAGPPADRITDP